MTSYYPDKHSEEYPIQYSGIYSEVEIDQCLIWVYLDVFKFTNESLNLEDLVFPSLLIGNVAKQYFIDSLNESQINLQKKLTFLSKVITDRVIEKSQCF